jgi:hypothetical protein
MSNPLMVFENIKTAPRRRLFTLWGVPWLATPWAWASVPAYLAAGIALAVIVGAGESGEERFTLGLGYGVLLLIVSILHSVGHIIGGKWAGHPMDANLITATRHVNIYRGHQGHLPRRVHLGRALGGPVMNLVAGAVALIVGQVVEGSLIDSFGMINLVAGLLAFLPIPTIDGEVIWREILK